MNDLIKTVNVTYKTGVNLEETTTVESKYVVSFFVFFFKKLTFKLLLQDVTPSSNTKGTVVTLSGSPGTHNDFKYMKSFFEQKKIRLICTNYPGSEFVTGGLHNSYTNQDRNSYMKSLMETLELKNVNRLIIMGHSRGGENALQLTSMLSVSCLKSFFIKPYVQNDENWPLVGAVMINSPGFAPHKGISKRYVPDFFLSLPTEKTACCGISFSSSTLIP